MSHPSWNPESLCPPALRCAVLLLNQTVVSKGRLSQLWGSAALRVAVDGGANHAFDIRASDSSFSKPHWVTGDFDSIRPEVLKQYEGDDDVRVEKTPDQDYTDFTKALMKVAEITGTWKEEDRIGRVVAFVENGGRLDQIMANVETLFSCEDIFKNYRPRLPEVLLASSGGTAWLLRPKKGSSDRHVIRVPSDTSKKSYYVGLIPIGEPAKTVTTTGLKWNLDKGELAFGKLVSTSNAFAEGAKEVTVETDVTLLFTVETS